MIKLIKDGQVITDNQFKDLYPNISFPAEIPFADYGYDVVFPKPAPDYNKITQRVVQIGPVLNVLGKYEEAWEVVSIYADYTDDLGVLHTKASQESEAIATLLATDKSALILQIDTDVDALIRAVIGERGSEYELSEKEATAYKAAAYPAAPVPSSVSSWAIAKGWTNTAAADDIIAAATGWRSAQSALRTARLLRKQQAANAADAAALNVIQASWNSFLSGIKTSLRV